MRKPSVLSLAASALVAAPLAAVPPAFAEAVCYSTLIEAASTPARLDLDHPAAHITGRLLARRSSTEDPVPVPGATLNVTPNGTVTTAEDGTFATDVRDKSWTALSFPGDGQYCKAATKTVDHPIDQSEVTLTAKREPASDPLQVGDAVTVAGTLTHGTTPASGVKVVLEAAGKDQPKTYATTTGADGAYSITYVPERGGSWSVHAESSLYTKETPKVWGYVRVQDAVPLFSGFTVTPNPAAYSLPVRIRAKLERLDIDGSRRIIGPTWVDVEYSADGKAGWTKVARAWVNAQGEIDSLDLDATKDGYLRLSFPGEELSLTRPGTSEARYLDVRTGTDFTQFNAAPEPVRTGGTLTVSGILLRLAGKAWTPVGSGNKVTIQFRADGATTWTTMGTTTTDRNGAFRKQFTASKKGTWRATYAGNATYTPATSTGDEVVVGTRTAFASGFNASPEPVRKGASLKVAGKLNRYVGDRWVHAGSGAVIQIQFKASGSSTWTTLGTTKTTSAGTFARTFKAVKDGTWRAVYTG
ncbi:hypothetical protein, partial [Actinomadura rayongensis]|nr:hypothetical protein [Actinomadura rayongensis]